MKKELLLAMAITATMLSGCHHNHNHNHDHGHDDQHEEVEDHAHEHDMDHDHKHEVAGGVHFTKDMSWGVDFETDTATLMSVGNTIHTIAQIQPTQTDEVLIVAKTDGIILLNNITEGKKTSNGEILGNIDASQTAASNLSEQQQHAKIELDRTESAYNKIQSLHSQKLATDTELRQAKAEYENARASLNSLTTGFKSGSQNVTSTKNGYIKKLFVKNGEFVNTGNPIVSITQNKTLQLKAEVPASKYTDLSNYSDAIIDGKPIKELGGKLLSYGRQTSVENPLIPVLFDINNVDGFLPGTFVDMYIKTTPTQKSVCVANGAILEESGIYFVYVQHSVDYFEKRLVTIGSTDGIYTEIKSGITEGEIVVTKGAMLVRMQQNTGSVDPHSGHSH